MPTAAPTFAHILRRLQEPLRGPSPHPQTGDPLPSERARVNKIIHNPRLRSGRGWREALRVPGEGLFLLLLALAAPCARAATLNVPSSAYSTIQAGINAAVSGDTVLVADGTYTGPGNVDLDFGGRNITVTSQHGASKTIIDCGGHASSDSSRNHRGFYIHSGETSAVVSGFTVQNGYTNFVQNITDSGNGGGICIDGASATIQNCVIQSNTASGGSSGYGGGGVCNINQANGVTITVTNCIISGNTSDADGGLENINSGTIILTNCIITKNGSGFYGSGGVGNSNQNNGTITLTNCTITDNAAGSYSGGGVYNYNENGTITLTNCTITGNTAASQGNGGVYNYNNGNGTITLVNTIIYGDSGGNGVEVFNFTGNDTLSHCDVQGGDGSGNDPYPGTGNIDADPLFVDAANGDLHLLPGSPCLGKGTANGAPLLDLDGHTRPFPPSIGAYDRTGPATLRAFSLFPGTVSAPGPTVSASVTAGGPLNSVRITCAAAQFNGTPPSFPMTLSATPNVWNVSFPTGFLKNAKVNPLPLVAIGTRADGTTTQLTAPLTVNPNEPALALAFGSLTPAAGRGQMVTLTGTVYNSSTTPSAATTVTSTLPTGADFVSEQGGLTYDASAHTLTWSGSLPTLSGRHTFSYTVRVNPAVPKGSTLDFAVTAGGDGFQSVTQDFPVAVAAGLVPVDVEVNASGGFGILDGQRVLNQDTTSPPLNATLSPVLTSTTLYGDRPFSIWMGCTPVGQSSGVTLSQSSDPVAAALASVNLIAPSASPQYVAAFQNVGDHVSLSVSFTPQAAIMTLFEALLTGIGEKKKKAIPSLDHVLAVLDNVSNIGSFQSAAGRFQPLPSNPYQYGKAALLASYDLLSMSGTDRKALQAIVNSLLGTSLKDGEFSEFLDTFFGVKGLLEMSSDLIVLSIQTKGDAMTVRFEASPLVPGN